MKHMAREMIELPTLMLNWSKNCLHLMMALHQLLDMAQGCCKLNLKRTLHIKCMRLQLMLWSQKQKAAEVHRQLCKVAQRCAKQRI